jgi:hypothetical protein
MYEKHIIFVFMPTYYSHFREVRNYLFVGNDNFRKFATYICIMITSPI